MKEIFWEVADPRIQTEYYIAACIITLLIVVIGRRKRNIAAKTALVVYMFLVLASTVFSRQLMPERIAMIVPGWSIVRAFQTGSTGLIAEIILNVLMLLPLGILIPLAFDCVDGWDVMLTALVFSIVIEVSQFLSMRGWFELDDIFNNTLGAIIGWLPVYCIKKRAKHN